MNKFKVNHELPSSMLWDGLKYNDYDFCLPHLLDEDENYRNYFFEAKKKGRYIIMDNSLHELGTAYDEDRLIYWINALEPHEFIVPDVWMNSDKTIINARIWKQKLIENDKTELVAVVQSEDLGGSILCYQTLKDLGYNKIAFSYGADWYLDYNEEGYNEHYGKMYGRVKHIKYLIESNIIEMGDRIHLLGCQLPQEFQYYTDIPNIESIDTSSPVMAGLELKSFKSYGLDEKPTYNLNTHFEKGVSKSQKLHILDNIIKFRQINKIQKQ